jgi:hypothetical protein
VSDCVALSLNYSETFVARVFGWLEVKGFVQIGPAGIAIPIPRTRASGAPRLNANQTKSLMSCHMSARSRKFVNNPG